MSIKSGPINPSKFGSSASRHTAGSRSGAGTGAGMFDFERSKNASQTLAQQGLPSTQGVNQANTKAAAPPTNPRSANSNPSNPVAGSDLKPKSVKRVADTDWYLVTSQADSKYFLNRKTNETATKLPQSVADHIGRLVAAAENASVAKRPAKLPQEPVPTPPSAQTSKPASSTSSFLQQGVTKQQETQEPIKPIEQRSTSRAESPTSLASVQKQVDKFEDAAEEGEEENAQFLTFTPEQREKRRQEIYAEIERETGQPPTEEFSDEQMNDILTQEALDAEDIPEAEIIAYTSRISKRPTVAATVAEIEKINRGLSEEADKRIDRGEAEALVRNFDQSISNLRQKLDQRVQLNERELSVLMNGLLNLSKAQNAQRKWSDAKKSLETAKRADHNHTTTHLIEAYNLLAQKDMAAGMKAIDRALDVDPNNIQALMLMAKTYFDLEAFDSAEAVIDDVLIMEKQNYLARVLKGRILEEAGNRHDAMLWTQKAIRLNPSRPEAFVQEGRLLLTIGQEEDGVAAVQKALEIDKKHGPAFTLLGLFFLNKEMYEDAEGAFRVALNINPWNTEALVAMSTIALKNEEWKSVLSFSSRAIESHEDSVEAWHQKGQAELELQLWTSSIASLERAISYNPSNSEDAFLMLSAALHGAGRTKDSIARLDELLRFKPTSSKAMINKGFALQTMGKPDEALALFDKAISVDAQDNEAKFGRIGALAALGRRDEAKAYYDSFKPRNGGTEAQEAESAFQMAMQIASQTSAASQKRQQDAEAATSSSSSAFNNRTDSVDSTTSESEAQLHMDMDNLEEDANQAMSLDPNEIMNMSPEDMSRAMRMPTPSEFDANMSSDAMLSELQSEIGRVNDLLGRMGLKKMPSAPNDATGMPDYSTFGDFSNFRPDQFDPSSVDPEDLREYNQILSDLQTDIREGKMPDPTDKDSVASQLGLSPDVVQRINEMQQYFDEHGVAGEKKKIEDLKDLNIAPRKVSKQEMEQDRLAFMREFAAAAREMKPNKGKKKSSKKPL